MTEPSGSRPAIEEPAAHQPANGESTVGRPAARELVLGRPVVGRPVVGELVVGQPVVGESVVAEPVIRRPTVSLRRILPSILLNAGIPLLVYTLLRSRVGSDATALAIGAVIPVAVTAIRFGWRRRLDPAGVIAGMAFGIALLVLVLSGGNPLILKLQDAVVTGPLGLVCLISVLVRRPLYLVVCQLLGRRNPAFARMAADPNRRRASGMFTTMVGATLFVHALGLLVLALSVPTGTFLALSRPVGWSILALGGVVVYLCRRRITTRRS